MLHAPIIVHLLPEFILLEFLHAHEGRLSKIPAPNGFGEDVLTCKGIVNHLPLDVVRIVKVKWRLLS